MRIIDRYVIRQFLMPFAIGLVAFTFIFIIRTLMEYIEPLVARGVSTPVLVTVLATLVPQALALSIPIALLLGLLVAFGRLSSNREFVAMQACGISLRRLLVPVGICSGLTWLATSYVMLVAVPFSNQAFREAAFTVLASRAEGEVRPRVFFTDYPNLTIYVQEVPPEGGWHGVFLVDARPGAPQAVFLARRGHVLIDRAAREVELVLEQGSRHTTGAADDAYEVSRFERFQLRVDPSTIFPTGGVEKDIAEMTIAELRTRIAEDEGLGVNADGARMALHRKFAIPVACLVLGIIGLALGATNRRDGSLGSFGLGLAIIFAYYIPLFLFPQMTKGGYLPPWLAIWLPNILFGLLAVVLFTHRARAADQPLRIPVPGWPARLASWASSYVSVSPTASPIRILDRYVLHTYLRILGLAAGAAVAIFYISTFIDLSDKLFKGNAPWFTLVEYLWYATPQFAYYILPISVLMATLVTIGTLTTSSELIVMKASGVSLYRAALPMLAVAALAGGMLFLLDATILADASRVAQARRDQILNRVTLRPLHYPWVAGSDGTIYSIRAYDVTNGHFEGLEVFELDQQAARMRRRTFAARALHVAPGDPVWRLEDGWMREFGPTGGVMSPMETFETTTKTLERIAYFADEPPDTRFMRYGSLREHTEQLRASGFNVREHDVALDRRVAFPFVTLVMTLIAIPFAVTIGRGGAMAGIGAGVALALLYWGTLSISAALGSGGLLPPLVAAWAPNLLFGTGALYLLLRVRT